MGTDVTDDMKPHLTKLAEAWIVYKMSGRDIKRFNVSGMTFFEDGRSREKWLKRLRAGEYIVRDEEDANYYPTSKSYDEVTAQMPNLVSLLLGKNANNIAQLHEAQRFPGINWEDLSLAEKKWVAEHPADYEVFVVSLYGHDIRAQLQIGVPGGWDKRDIFNTYIAVTDKFFRAAKAEHIYKLRFNHVKERNLAWGLKAMDLIEPVDGDMFRQPGSDFLSHGESISFSHAPEKWESELEAQVTEARKQIAMLRRKANVLLETRAKIHEMGGWGKFHEKYEALLHTELKKEPEESK